MHVQNNVTLLNLSDYKAFGETAWTELFKFSDYLRNSFMTKLWQRSVIYRKGAGGQGMGVAVSSSCIVSAALFTLFPCSSVESHPQETDLHDLLQHESFPQAAVLHELFQHRVLHRLWVDCVLHHGPLCAAGWQPSGLNQGLQGNLCSHTWSTFSHSSSLILVSAELLLSHTLIHLFQLLLSNALFFLTYVITEPLSPSLFSSALAIFGLSWSQLELAVLDMGEASGILSQKPSLQSLCFQNLANQTQYIHNRIAKFVSVFLYCCSKDKHIDLSWSVYCTCGRIFLCHQKFRYVTEISF